MYTTQVNKIILTTLMFMGSNLSMSCNIDYKKNRDGSKEDTHSDQQDFNKSNFLDSNRCGTDSFCNQSQPFLTPVYPDDDSAIFLNNIELECAIDRGCLEFALELFVLTLYSYRELEIEESDVDSYNAVDILISRSPYTLILDKDDDMEGRYNISIALTHEDMDKYGLTCLTDDYITDGISDMAGFYIDIDIDDDGVVSGKGRFPLVFVVRDIMFFVPIDDAVVDGDALVRGDYSVEELSLNLTGKPDFKTMMVMFDRYINSYVCGCDDLCSEPPLSLYREGPVFSGDVQNCQDLPAMIGNDLPELAYQCSQISYIILSEDVIPASIKISGDNYQSMR